MSVGSGRPIGKGDRKPLPRLIIAAEHYNRMMRILEKGIDVEMEVNVKIEYDEKDLVDYNVIAEIPGTDLCDEVVMIGGDYDAKSSRTGATDKMLPVQRQLWKRCGSSKRPARNHAVPSARPLHFGALKKPDSSVHGRMFVTRLEVSTMKAVNLNMISYRSTSIWIGTAQGYLPAGE